MTAFLFQNLKLIMLFLLIGSVIGLANIRSKTRIAIRSLTSINLRPGAHQKSGGYHATHRMGFRYKQRRGEFARGVDRSARDQICIDRSVRSTFLLR
jgi:hypothetical protein